MSYQPAQLTHHWSQLHSRHDVLYFKVLSEHLTELMPVVYTPTVGEAIQRFSGEYRGQRGLYLSIDRPRRDRRVLRDFRARAGTCGHGQPGAYTIGQANNALVFPGIRLGSFWPVHSGSPRRCLTPPPNPLHSRQTQQPSAHRYCRMWRTCALSRRRSQKPCTPPSTTRWPPRPTTASFKPTSTGCGCRNTSNVVFAVVILSGSSLIAVACNAIREHHSDLTLHHLVETPRDNTARD